MNGSGIFGNVLQAENRICHINLYFSPVKENNQL